MGIYTPARSENSGNELEEVGGGASEKAAKPQSGRIRHRNDCSVETSNFSSSSAQASRAAAGVPSSLLVLGFWLLGIDIPHRRIWKRNHVTYPPLPKSQSTLWGATDQTRQRLWMEKFLAICFRKGPGFPGHYGNPKALNNGVPGKVPQLVLHLQHPGT